MSIEFTSSENCKIDGVEMVYFSHPVSLLNRIEKVLKEIGPERFFSSTDERIKKIRESLAEFFFLMTVKQTTGLDPYLMQPKEQFPDFVVMTVSEVPLVISLSYFELVEIPPRCASFEEMMHIVTRKLNKGYPKGAFSLLIFVNHERSAEWVGLLNKRLTSNETFLSIWTVRLLFNNNEKEISSAVADQIFPLPKNQVEARMGDISLHTPQYLPSYMNEEKTERGTFRKFKPDFLRVLLLEMKKKHINNMRIANSRK